MKSIYTILMCEKIENYKSLPRLGSQRLVGFYESEYDAINAVKENTCDLWEYCYDYAIVERVYEGVFHSDISYSARFRY